MTEALREDAPAGGLKGLLQRVPTHLIVVAANWISRIVSGTAGVISIRFLLQSLGQERYAVFALINSLQGWYSLSDFGLGASLQNHVSQRRAHGKSDADLLQAAGAAALALLVTGFALLTLFGPFVARRYLQKFDLPDAAKLEYFALASGLLIITVIGGIAYRVWYGQQRGYLSTSMPALGSVISLGAVVLAGRTTDPERMRWCLLAGLGPSALVAIASLGAVLVRSLKHGFARIDRAVLKKLLKLGSEFWIFALMSAALLHVDYLVMSQAVPAEDIVRYNLSTKIFDAIRLFYGAVLLALWPTCTELIAKNDWSGVMRYLRRYITIGMGGMLLITPVLVVAMPYVIQVLSPKKTIEIPWTFVLLLGLYEIGRVWTNTFAMVLQSMSRVRIFWVVTSLNAGVNAGLQILLAPRLGLHGITISLILANVLTSAWVLPRAVLQHARKGRLTPPRSDQAPPAPS